MSGQLENAAADPDLDPIPRSEELPGGALYETTYTTSESDAALIGVADPWHRRTPDERSRLVTDALVARRRVSAQARQAGFPSIEAYLAAVSEGRSGPAEPAWIRDAPAFDDGSEDGTHLEAGRDRKGSTEASFRRDSWPASPADAAYHGLLGDIALAIAPHSEADPVGLLGTGILMFGAACGGHRTLYQGSRQAANTSICLVGGTGISGRKGTSLDAMRAVFELAYPALGGLLLVGVAAGEAIVGHLSRHESDPRVLLIEPEFGRLLTIMNRDGSTASQVLRNAWDGVPLGYARARDESLVTNHHVSMLGHVTPVELRSKLTEIDAANGFANRILFLAVRRQRLVPFPTSPDRIVQAYVPALHRAIEEAERPAELAFDAAARDRWESFYFELALTQRPGLAGALMGREEAHVARLALIYALADRSDFVRLPHLEAAIALAEYARRSAVWALGDSTGNRHADALRDLVADGPVPWMDARRALGLRTAADMRAAVDVLLDAEMALVKEIPRIGGGRPLRVICPADPNIAKGAKNPADARSHERA
jgi:hypothetical protein